METRAFVPLLLIGLIAAGCGGGGGLGASNSIGQESVYGPFQTRATGGRAQVGTVSSGGATVTAVYGSAFTKITYAPTPLLSNTRIAFNRDGGLSQLYVMNSNDPTTARALPGIDQVTGQPSWSRDGRIAVERNFGPGARIWVVNADGSNPHQISVNAQCWAPAWAPDNYHIAYTAFDAARTQIYTMTANGGSVTKISDGTADDSNPSWSPDSSQIFFQRFNTTTNHPEIWKMNANGSSPTRLLYGNANIESPVAAPVGTQYLFTEPIGTTQAQLGVFNYTSGVNGIVFDVPNTFAQYPSWSADASKIMFYKYDGISNEIDVATPDGNNRTTLLAFGDRTLQGAACEPFPVPEPYVSSTGGYVLGSSSSGFLYGLKGDAFTSFLTFTATTPGSVTITADPVIAGQSNLVYRISADALTSLKYINGFGSAVNTVTLAAGTKGAVVSFNASTGGVQSVLPLGKR